MSKLRTADITKNRDLKDFQDEPLDIDAYLDSGTDGLVFKGHYRSLPDLTIAVKFYVPMLNGNLFASTAGLPRFLEDLRKRHDKELMRLKELSHPYLQEYMSAGRMRYDKHYFMEYKAQLTVGEEVPFLVSRYIHGSKLSTILRVPTTTRERIITVLLQIVEGLRYLHSNDVLHGDIREDNILVETVSGNARIIDFGLAKRLSIGDPEKTQLFASPDTMPTEIRSHLRETLDKDNSSERGRLRDLIFPCMDLYCFGRLLLAALRSESATQLTDFDREYLAIVLTELDKWKVLDEMTTMKGYITSAVELSTHLHKLFLGSDYFRQTLRTQHGEAPRKIQRTGGEVVIRDTIAPYISHPGLRRLHNVHQLALIHYVYPSAGQSRFDHVLATLGTTQLFWNALSLSPMFLFHMNSADVERLELLALHHDLNHFPFLHYFQEAGIPEFTKAKLLKVFLNIGAPKTLGELLAKEGIDEDYLRSMMFDTVLNDPSPAQQIMKSILNSGIDVDKLAYVRDDATYTGVPFGFGVDIQGIMSGVDIDVVDIPRYGKGFHVVFRHDALPAIESLCFARYWNFQRIYWHHTNRAVAAMVIYTINVLYDTIGAGLESFLLETQHADEAAALQYLAKTYKSATNKLSPIEGLWSNRDLIYKKIWELSFIGQEKLLHSLQDEKMGHENRRKASKKVRRSVIDFLHSHGWISPNDESEILLDIPMRTMDLGGLIFVRNYDGTIEPISRVSPIIRELEGNFSSMSKTLRVFVSPRIRDGFGKARWNELRGELYRKISEGILKDDDVKEVE